MAGEPVDVETDLDRLWQLQQVDARIDAIRRELEGHPLLRELDDRRREAAGVDRRLEELGRQIPSLRLEVRQGELEVRSAEEEIAQLEGRLFGGRVSNPKELASLEARLGVLRRRHGEMEEQVLQRMMDLDQAQQEQQAQKARRDRLQSELDGLAAQWAGVEARLVGEMERLSGERERLEASISDASFLSRYRRLYGAKGGKAVALVEGDRCGECGVPLPNLLLESVRRRDRLVPCEVCGRLLYRPPAADPSGGPSGHGGPSGGGHG